MEKLRKAIIELAAGDIGVMGEMSEWTENVVEAFNEVVMSGGINVETIQVEHIEGEFD